MVRGKTINIYLPDGNPKGIKICEIPNSIIKAIVIPRNMINEVLEFENLEKVGIYFLFSEKDESGQFKTYIGEAEEIKKRLKQHNNSDKEYWNYMVCFVSGKDNLNKAHVKFLESYCHEEAKKADRTELMNGCSPTRSTLSPSERDFSLQFFDEMGLILGTLGYPIFSKIKKAEKQEEIFYCKKKGAEATGNLTEEGFVVYAGSTANLEERPSITKWVKSKRDELIEKRILIQKSPTLYEFSKDFVFTSPSIASAVVVGGNANGWLEWKNLNGTTMDELKRQNSS